MTKLINSKYYNDGQIDERWIDERNQAPQESFIKGEELKKMLFDN
jgi:hypothetical protein